MKNTTKISFEKLHYNGSVVVEYMNALLFGSVKEYLDKQNISVFKGISKSFTKKYMKDFNIILRLNNYSVGEIDNAIIVHKDNEPYHEYYGFIILAKSRATVHGSFQSAYMDANISYTYLNDIGNDIPKELCENTNVFFGKIVYKDKKIVEYDLECVVNFDFQNFLY